MKPKKAVPKAAAARSGSTATLTGLAQSGLTTIQGTLKFENQSDPHLFRCFIDVNGRESLLVQDVGMAGVFTLDDVVTAARTLFIFHNKRSGQTAQISGRFEPNTSVTLFVMTQVLA